MPRAFYARLGHHSLTCFSKTVACPTRLAAASRKRQPQDSILQHSDSISTAFFLSGFPTGIRSFATAPTKNLKTTIMNGAAHGTIRSKRKQHPGMVEERPQKQHRAINGKESAGENTPEISTMFDEEMELQESPRLGAILGAPADTAEWQATIEKVVRNVVSIRFCQTCSFDTDPALTSEATGFVVDAERGWVFTRA